MSAGFLGVCGPATVRMASLPPCSLPPYRLLYICIYIIESTLLDSGGNRVCQLNFQSRFCTVPGPQTHELLAVSGLSRTMEWFQGMDGQKKTPLRGPDVRCMRVRQTWEDGITPP